MIVQIWRKSEFNIRLIDLRKLSKRKAPLKPINTDFESRREIDFAKIFPKNSINSLYVFMLFDARIEPILQIETLTSSEKIQPFWN